MRDFKRALAILSAKPKVIEEEGGIKAFLDHNLLPGVRISPTAKLGSQSEDTELGMNPESYLMVKEILGPQSGDALGGGSSVSVCRVGKAVALLPLVGSYCVNSATPTPPTRWPQSGKVLLGFSLVLLPVSVQ